MTGPTTTDAAHALLVRVDPVSTPPTFDAAAVAAVVQRARAAEPRSDHRGHLTASARRRRLAAGAAGVAVAAAVTSVAVVVLPGGERVGVRAPAAVADPVTVLRQAATVAATAPFTPPRADQFIFVDGGTYHAWISVDGTHDGLVVSAPGTGTAGGSPLPGCRDGVALEDGNYEGVRPTPCTPDPGYLPDVPTDPTALRAWLVERAGPATNAVAKEVIDLLDAHLVAPAVRAALFEVVSTSDGLSVTTDGVPPGHVAVAWQLDESSSALLFSATDHRFLGSRAGGGGTTFHGAVVVDAVGRTG